MEKFIVSEDMVQRGGFMKGKRVALGLWVACWGSG